MSGRLHRIGTIYSRINGFIRKELIKNEDRPIWYDVYSHFPPVYEPTYGRPAPDIKIRKIFYPEDSIRAKIHKAFPKNLGEINLSDSKAQTQSKRLIKVYNEYISQGLSEDEAIEQVKNKISKPERGISQGENPSPEIKL